MEHRVATQRHPMCGCIRILANGPMQLSSINFDVWSALALRARNLSTQLYLKAR
jgi:hypothetical protein